MSCRLIEKHNAVLRTWVLIVSLCSIQGLADTFTNLQNGRVLHGYVTSGRDGAETFVNTQEKGLIKLNLQDWRITPDRAGRENSVVVFSLEGPVMYEIETAAFERAVTAAADEGPLFILLEIDTPGGRIDLANRICAAIAATNNCQVVAYVKGGLAGGAISAGAAVALACDKIYMAEDTIIGAATMITGQAESMKQAFGEDVGEKFDSAWRARLASLAEQHGRSALLARAMVDRDIEVIEVGGAGRRAFIDPVNRKPDQTVVRTWSKKGSLLTLTAAEAVEAGIADGIAASRLELLRQLDAESAKIIPNDEMQKAVDELRRAEGQLNRLRKAVDLKVKKAEGRMYQGEALKLLREARRDFKTLIKLGKKYPDLQLDIVALEDELNSIEATYQRIKRESRRR